MAIEWAFVVLAIAAAILFLLWAIVRAVREQTTAGWIAAGVMLLALPALVTLEIVLLSGFGD